MFLWLAGIPESGFPEMSKNRLLLHLSDAGLLSACPFQVDLAGALTSPAPVQLAALSLPVRATYRILALLGERYKIVAQRQEEGIRHLEEAHVDARGARFLREAFRLQRGITAASADLWRLKEIVQKLADGKVPLQGADAQNEPPLNELLSEFEVVDQDFRKIKEDLKSLMELHMNITSFEMNKFMKLLAIVGFLGLIPSVAGGLLGMNVAGNPWSVTLGQVAFGIAMGMAISLYVFAIKGWLR
ncbi:MAG: CorA family divalent cation transporter [Acidobacteriota bacterium]|nr:hypothetical protein [Acidobacteriota bacterium]MDQ3420618.1 CorA family divalent cation transporter [Acidobacteriota bacterium]